MTVPHTHGQELQRSKNLHRPRCRREKEGTQGRSSHLDGAGDVRLLPAKDYLSRNCNPIEEVVDEAHVVDECVHVTGDQHQQRGETLGRRERRKETGGDIPG